MNKFKLNCLLVVLNLIWSTQLVAQVWSLAKQSGGSSQYGEWAKEIVVDKQGNVYVTGTYCDSASFDTVTIHASPYYSGFFFLAKYNLSGNLLWIKTAGGECGNSLAPDWNSGNGLVLDQNNNCYVVGNFAGTAIFDTISMTSYGNQDIFIAMYDSSGNCKWVSNAGGSNRDLGQKITIDEQDNLYITGSFASANVFFDTLTLLGGTNNKLFIAKYNNSGDCKWAMTTSGTGSSSGYDLKNYKGEIYFTGYADSSTTIDGNFIDKTGGLLAVYDTSGSFSWFKSIKGGVGNGISFDNTGNIYLNGAYNNGTALDTITLFQNNGYWDSFIAKFNNLGNIFWVKTLSASTIAIGWDISTDSIGNSYVTGEFSGTAQFGNVSIISDGVEDVYAARFNSSGDCLGAAHAGSFGTKGWGIAVDSGGACYVAGEFFDTVSFGTTTLMSRGANDIFWAKLDELNNIQNEERRGANSLLIYANPNKGKCNIIIPAEFKHEKNLTLSIYDSKGALIKQDKVQMNEDKVHVNLEHEAKAIYNVTLSNGNKNYNGKIVLK